MARCRSSATNIGAQVIVDGKKLGYTPDKLSVPYAQASARDRAPDGTSVHR